MYPINFYLVYKNANLMPETISGDD